VTFAGRWFSSFALGLVAALAMPPLNAWPSLFLAVPFFLIGLSGKSSARGSFWHGWFFGFGYFCLALHWIGYAFLVDASTYLWMMPFAVGGLAAFLAIYWGLAAGIAQACERRWNMPLFFTFPAFLAMGELLRGRLLTGFPWAAPGLAADGMGGVLQVASLVGMEGLTLLLLLWTASPFAFLRAASGRARFLCLGLLMLLPAGFAWGHLRLQQHPSQFDEKVVFRIVQPNVMQGAKWDQKEAAAIFKSLLDLSRSETATHIVWPESSIPFLIDESEDGITAIADMLQSEQTLISGVIRRSAPSNDADYFTSVMVFNTDGQVTGVYDKWRLVPGGEFLPLEWLLEPLGFKRLVTLPGGFSWGAGAKSIAVPGLGLAGFLICYEVIFPNQLVDPAQRPRVLINVTNDGWFGTSTGPYQHLAQARLRAVEQGLPLIRSANTGISAVVDPLGRIIRSSKLDDKEAFETTLPQLANTVVNPRLHTILSIFLILMIVIAARICAQKLH
jgi:apolipoprotein N-acyltransferase